MDMMANKKIKQINTQLSDMTTQEVSANMFNKDSANNVSGHYLDPNGGSPVVASDYSYSHLIPVEVGQAYTYPVYTGMFGGSATWLLLYDGNGNYIGRVNGTIDASSKYNTVVVSNASAVYAKINYKTVDKTSFMFVKGSSYPTQYSIYGVKTSIKNSYISNATFQFINPLYGKVAIFEGDSICHGTSVGSSDPTYGWGWAGRIGTKNNMSWNNYGISGGTIAYIDSSRHCVSRSISAMRADADYIILEGGTNDADLLGNGNFGTLTTGYTATLDDTTFAGAMESMLKQAIIKYPSKKIGFIIAHKMGNPPSDNRKAFFNLAMQACDKWGIPYLNLWDKCYLNASIPAINTAMYTDGQHLTSAGYDYITPMIEAWMKTL